ncbi:MAG: sensor histidine kinase [Alphaproteobacteria bacterium]|nr:sensor histidine kinase [Alphaproteobacteria bacterium]
MANNASVAAAAFCEADANGRGRFKLWSGDDGPGIPERLRNQTFQPCHASTTKEGTSLGLAIARDTAAAHGGSLTLDLSNSDGTEFHLDLPIVP